MIKRGTHGDDALSDTIQGGDDFIFAQRGDDVVSSLDGRDFIFAGSGDDNVTVKLRDADVFVGGGKGDDSLLVLGDPIDVETHGKVTIITDESGFQIIARGVEHIEYIDLF